MKVLMINAVWKTGSTGRNLFEMKSVMESDGFSVLVAATHLQEQTPDFFRIGSPLDWKLHGLFSRLLGTQGNFSKNARFSAFSFPFRIFAATQPRHR